MILTLYHSDQHMWEVPAKQPKASGVLHPIPVLPKIWCQVGIDLIGPMPETPRVNKYVVTTSRNGLKLHHWVTRMLWVWQRWSMSVRVTGTRKSTQCWWGTEHLDRPWQSSHPISCSFSTTCSFPQAQHLDQQDPNAISARIDQLLQSRKEPFKVARSPVFSRSTNLESKLIEFFVFVNFNTQSILRVFIQTFTVLKIGDFPHFLSELPSNNQFIIKLVKM